MKDQIYIEFLKNFFSLFDADIEKYTLQNNILKGSVFWPDDPDKQDFKWIITIDSYEAANLSELCYIIKTKGYNRNDHILISEEQLSFNLQKYGWEKEMANSMIEKLLHIEIKMIDDGKETDSFFVHF